MPELPEVEVICQRLRSGCDAAPPLVGRRIVKCSCTDSKALVDITAPALSRALIQRRVVDVSRRAKWILLELDDGQRLVVHLRMTGDLFVRRTSDRPKYERLALDVGEDWTLSFVDPRRFGRVHLVDDPRLLLQGLGPEPLDPGFRASDLQARLHGTRTIKALLLDQSVLAGLGNIYADESLFAASIHPMRKASSLGPADVVRLHRAIRRTLKRAIVENGKEVAWRYQNRATQSPFLVYERAKLPCRVCGTTLSTTRIANRTTVFCPHCQAADPRS